MKPVKDAKRYAKTLISIVGIEDTPDALAELSLIEDLISKSKEFRSMLLNPVFSQAQRNNALKQVAVSLKLSDKMVRFVIHLTEIRVIVLLSRIIKIASAIYLEKKRRVKATVLTPVEISKNHEDRLRTSLKKLTGRDVNIEIIMDPSLLGGVLIKVGSMMYDTSIKGQLRLLKYELIKE